MHTYVKLKDGRIVIIWSDNTEEETMHVYPVDMDPPFDIEVDSCEMVNYDDVVVIDSNRSVVENYKETGDKL